MPITKTDLLDRYLNAVKFWLPKAQQQDIVAELAEDLNSQMEECETRLGHPLGEDDLAALLKRRGTPMQVASGYLPEQRLINPAMLPVYRLVLKIVLLWVLTPLFAIVFIGPLFTSADPGRVMLLVWGEAWRTGFTVFGVVTAVFALLERYHVKIEGLDNWDPRKLPHVPAAQETSARWNHLAGFIFGTLAAACWLYALRGRTGFWFPDGVHLTLGPIWKYTYWPVFGLTMAGALIDLLAFVDPAWTRFRSRGRLGIDACTLVMLAALLKAGNWVEIAVPNLSARNLANITVGVNACILISLIVIAIITLGDAVQAIRRLLRAGDGRRSPVLSTR